MPHQLNITDYLLARLVADMEGISIEDAIKEAVEATKPEPVNKPEKPKSDETEEIVNRLYKLYPGKTYTNNGVRSTGKCSKDKQRISALLKTHTPEQIERIITNYVNEQSGMFLKNFATFLNNLPEEENDEVLTPRAKETLATGQLW